MLSVLSEPRNATCILELSMAAEGGVPGSPPGNLRWAAPTFTCRLEVCGGLGCAGDEGCPAVGPTNGSTTSSCTTRKGNT